MAEIQAAKKTPHAGSGQRSTRGARAVGNCCGNRTGTGAGTITGTAAAGAALSSAATSSAATSGTEPEQGSEVSRVRVWNADNYTRIIIELGGKAKYQAARISDPDRIYFDIENAKLSSELLHDPIEVPSGGYLKAVRVAQNRSDTVRVVLDVAKVKDYSVFELAGPDRLVVDVYGPGTHDAATANSSAKSSPIWRGFRRQREHQSGGESERKSRTRASRD